MVVSLPVPGPVFEGDDLDSDRAQGSELVLFRPPRLLSASESRAFWNDAYGLAKSPRRPYQIVVAWRLVRSLAIMQNRLTPEERLPRQEEEWREAWPTPGRPALAWEPRGRDADLADAFSELAYLGCIEEIKGNIGTMGLVGMLHPDTLSQAWPGRHAILDFEQTLLFQVQGFAIRWPRRKAVNRLREMLGLAIEEAVGIINMAIEEARRAAFQDADTKRFLMESYLEDYVSRQRESGDNLNEIRGLKLLATVQGLTRTSADDAMGQFVNAIAKVSTEQDSKPLLRLEA